MKVFADYHTHTRFSHGKGTVLDNVRAAARKGLEAVAITDHGPANLFGLGISSLAAFDDIAEQVERSRKEFPEVRVLMGVEANVINTQGGLDVPEELLERLDIVLAGHHLVVRGSSLVEWWKISARNYVARWSRRLAERARVDNTKSLIEAIRKNRVDIVTHPGLHVSIDTEELARECARAGTALEINAKHAHLDVGFIRAAAKQGATFCISSDAHSPEEVGDFGNALEVALRAGVDPERIINVRA
ncbi:MAG: PHP domain-containing protein [Firmicutes bacterium]|jgi:putative hydrolase|nr:PHP domain-containing protein [Bacillota bacterium]MDH7494437.1 PHP domain-containing protein [Bacillota bacterium]